MAAVDTFLSEGAGAKKRRWAMLGSILIGVIILHIAAGVVAGGLLFQGIQSLMGHNTPPPAAPSPLSNAQPDTLAPPEAHTAASGDEASFGPLADAGDSGDVSWDAGEDWA